MSSWYLHGMCFLVVPLLVAVLAVFRARHDATKVYRSFDKPNEPRVAAEIEKKDSASSGINHGFGGFSLTNKSYLFVIKAMWKLLFDIQQVLNAPPGVYGQYEITMRQRIKYEIDEVLSIATKLFGFDSPDDRE